MKTKLLIRRKEDAPNAPPREELLVTEPLITIGSDPGASLSLPGAGVAAEQAVIVNEDGLLLINHADGTDVNGRPLARAARHPLAPGDRLSFGDYVITLIIEEGNAPEEIRRAAERGEVARLSAADAVPGNGAPRAPGNFAAILDSLRTEEDSFYLLIEGGPDDGRRVRLDATEMIIGWDETGQRLVFDAQQIVARRALLRNVWTGVFVQALGAGLVAVNSEPVAAERRLSEGDRLTLVPTVNTAAQNQAILIFHEPASLTALDTMLPQKLPPPVAAAGAGLVPAPQAPALAAESRARPSFFSPERRYIRGYFTPVEILIMIVGTLVTAAIIFLVLELFA